MEHLPSVGLKYFVNPDTVARLGYQYSDVHYTSDDLLVGAPSNVTAETRDSRTHFYFLGLDHTFNPRLSTAVRGGAMTVSYPNDPVAKTRTNPYADLSITYRYLEGCYAQAGFRYSRTATDQVAYNAPDGSLVLDAEASLFYVNVVHAITSKLSANLLGGWQHSKFRGGTINGESDDYMTLSLGLSYEINKFFSAEAGYNFDTLWSNIANNGAPGRNYHRNYAFIGVKGTL
jgi:predicted porin